MQDSKRQFSWIRIAVWTTSITLALVAAALFGSRHSSPQPSTPQARIARKSEGIDPREYRFRLEQTPCYGPCPIYKLEIDGQGVVRYEGPDLRDSRQVGLEDKRRFRRTRRLADEDRIALAELVEHGDFWGLQSRYDLKPFRDAASGEMLTMDITDLPTTILTVWRGAESMTVSRHIVPCARTYPGQLTRDVLRAIPEPVPDVFCDLESAIEMRSCAGYWGQQAADAYPRVPLPHDPHCETTP